MNSSQSADKNAEAASGDCALAKFPRAHAAICKGIDADDHIGVQLCVSVAGRRVIDDALGLARAGHPMTPRTIMPWLSAGKPLGAILFGIAWERGLLESDEPVARRVPEFGNQGKEVITYRHILTHTCGFPGGRVGYPRRNFQECVATVCAMPLAPGAIPGRHAAYHISSSWFILGEALQRAFGKSYPDLVRDEIARPLGAGENSDGVAAALDLWVGMRPQEYDANESRIGYMHDASKRARSEAGVADEAPRRHADFPMPAWATGCCPGANSMATARAMCAVYERLLAGGAGILMPRTVAAMTKAQRVGMKDETFHATIDFGLGLIVNSEQYAPGRAVYGYGAHASPQAFGHGGNQGATAFCDPECGLAVACVFNGMPGEPRHQRRLRAFCDALYEDLGFA